MVEDKVGKKPYLGIIINYDKEKLQMIAKKD